MSQEQLKQGLDDLAGLPSYLVRSTNLPLTIKSKERNLAYAPTRDARTRVHVESAAVPSTIRRYLC